MVICDEPPFLFIHVPKAAGTSIAGAFAHLDLIRAGKKLKDAAQRKAWIEAKGFSEDALTLPLHGTAQRAQSVLGKEKLDSLFTFAIVRNPWDMELSWYTYNVQTESAPHYDRVVGYADFNDYVHRHSAEHGRLLAPGPQSKYVLDEDGTQMVDRILRYENLSEDFAGVVDHLGLEGIILDQFNQSYHAPWPEAYTADTFALVRDLVRPDIEAFGYGDDPAGYGID